MSVKPLGDKKIGQILLAERLIDQGQLEQALKVQVQQCAYKPLGEVLKDLGFVLSRDLRAVLAKYRKQILLGELFVNMGVISQHQLDQALNMQRTQRKRLGEILVDSGSITRSQLIDVICVQTGVQGINLKHTVADKELLKEFNAVFLRRKRVLPLKYDRDVNVLTLLMEDPSDTEALNDLKKMITAEIEPIVLRDWNVGHLLDDILDVWHRAK
jgi:type IV pilus assembly protein PilB